MYIFVLLIVFFSSFASSTLAAELIGWGSPEGIKRLERSQAKIDFFPLANHFESQENGLFCGVASSTIILNSLRLHNNAIHKPQDMSTLSKNERRYLPKGFNPFFERYTQHNVLNQATKTRLEILGKPVMLNGKAAPDYGLQLKQLAVILDAHGLNVTARVANDNLHDDTIRQELIANMETAGDYAVVNYSRKILGQEGIGHISPLGAYDKQSDSFLIMDTNPNNSGWVWAKTNDLITAMQSFDAVENRGYLLVKEGRFQ